MRPHETRLTNHPANRPPVSPGGRTPSRRAPLRETHPTLCSVLATTAPFDRANQAVGSALRRGTKSGEGIPTP